MSNELTTITTPEQVAQIGEIADAHAASAAFAKYQKLKAANTISRQHDDLADFARYLAAVRIERTAEALQHDPQAWRGMTWGIVDAYREWMAREGCAISAINLRLSTVRTYARLARDAGAIGGEAFAAIQGVRGYSHKEGKRIDEARDVTRKNTRKAKANVLSASQTKALRTRPYTPQGRRDAVLLGLLGALGLRVSEAAALTVGSVDLTNNRITFYRSKVDKTQTHDLKNGLAEAMRAYLAHDRAGADAVAPLLSASRKGGELTHEGMTRFAIAQRVRQIGREIGIDKLSPHDLRHTWATRAAERTPITALRDAGGWASLAMPSRYVAAAEIANRGVVFDE